MTVGTIANRIPSLARLRYCPSCFLKDERNYGEPYWHRSHQLPSIHICHIHRAQLLDSTVPATGIGCKNNLVPLSHEVFGDQESTIGSSTEVEHQIWLATAAHWLMNAPSPLPALDLKKLRQRYLHHLHRLGLATASGRLYTREISERFLEFYGGDFLNSMHCGFARESSDNWLLALLHHPERVKSPLQHLLLIRFVGLEIEDFLFDTPQITRHFGRGPWPCLNPAATHYKKRVISKCLVTRRPETGVVGTFSCECGFTYERAGPDSSRDDRYRIGRIVAFGPVWEKRLLDLRQAERKGLRETARILKVDPKTVQRHQDRLTIDSVIRNSDIHSSDAITLDSMLRCWLRLCASHPEMGVKKLRQLEPVTYTWLYRLDKAWLQAHRSQFQHRASPVVKVDWSGRDDSLASRIPEAAELIKKQPGRPGRISVSALGQILGANSLLEKKLKKLPRTRDVLATIVETKEDFAIRRLQLAAKTLNERNEPIRAWRLMKIAGVTPSSPPRVREEVERLVVRSHSDKVLGSDGESV